MASRLYRVLKDCPKPIFECVITDAATRYDSELTGATIHHGQADADAGVPVPTLEVGFKGYVSPLSGRATTFKLTPAAAAWIEAKTGATGLAPRFAGRSGTYTVDDTPKHLNTTATASGWTAQLTNRGTTHTFLRNAWLHDVITDLLDNPSLPVVLQITRNAPREKFGQIWDVMTDVTYADAIGKLTTDVGILAQQRRSGIIELFPLTQRKVEGLAAATAYPPIARNQIISPATWTTRHMNDPANHRVVTRDGAGAPVSLTFGNIAETWRDNTETDLQYLYFGDPEQWQTLGYSRKFREYTGAYSLPDVEVDLLALFDRGRPYDLLQIGALLALDAGDPVTFSGDWYPHLRGVFFAEEIAEEITPDSWKIKLTLVPYSHVIGEAPPAIRPRIWDQATGTWNAATGAWNSY